MYYLFLVPFFLCYPAMALAQTLTANGSIDGSQIFLELVSKTVLPAIVTLAGPFIASLLGGASPWIKVALAGVVSMLTGAAVGTIPTLPLSPESSGNMGLAMGLIGEILRQKMPKDIKKDERI